MLTLLSRCPRYRETPQLSSADLARRLGVTKVWLKDESQRMGLGSFKALGGAYAIARAVEREGREQTFCCASAGNHGLSVAAGAQAFGSEAVIFLSHSVPPAFQARIRDLGARVERFGQSYEESMKEATVRSEREGWVLISDSSWPGYLDVPTEIMEGYTVIAWECGRAFRAEQDWPTHVFLQAGVGGLAAAVTHQIRSAWGDQPRIVVVEPDQAPCLKAGVRAGHAVIVEGDSSNMGRLDCKEPSVLALEILSEMADEFVTVTDQSASHAEALLTSCGFPTTPSGAAGLAAALDYPFEDGDRPLFLVTEGPLL